MYERPVRLVGDLVASDVPIHADFAHKCDDQYASLSKRRHDRKNSEAGHSLSDQRCHPCKWQLYNVGKHETDQLIPLLRHAASWHSTADHRQPDPQSFDPYGQDPPPCPSGYQHSIHRDMVAENLSFACRRLCKRRALAYRAFPHQHDSNAGTR